MNVFLFLHNIFKLKLSQPGLLKVPTASCFSFIKIISKNCFCKHQQLFLFFPLRISLLLLLLCFCSVGQRRPRKNQSGQGSCCLQTQPKQMSNPPSLSWKCCYGCRWLKMEGNSLMCCKSISRTLTACRCIRLCTQFCDPWGRLMATGNCQAIFKQVRNSHGRLWKELEQGRFSMTVALWVSVVAEREDLVS